MVVKNYYVPTEITDYVDPLRKAYERQKNQDKQDLDNKLEWSKQTEKADPGVTSLNTIKAVAQFSATAAASVASIKGSIGKNKDKAQKKTNNILAALNISKTAEETIDYAAQWAENKELTIENSEGKHVKYKDHLLKQFSEGKIDRELFDFLDKAGVREQLRIREYQIGKLVEQGPAAYDAWRQDPKNFGAIKDEYGPWGNYNSWAAVEQGEGADNAYKQWFSTYLGKQYNLKTDVIGALVSPEVNRRAKQLKGTASNLYANTSYTNEASAWNEDINVKRKSFTNGGVNELGESIFTRFKTTKASYLNSITLPEGQEHSKEQKSWAASKAREDLTNQLFVMSNKGDLTITELNAIKAGQIKGYGGGDTAESILTKEQWKRLENSIIATGTATVNAKKEEAARQLNAQLAALQSGQGSETDLQTAKRNYISYGGKESDPVYTAAENYVPANNTKEAAKAELERWMPYITGNKKGSLRSQKLAISQIKNPAIRKQLLNQLEKEESLKNAVLFPKTRTELNKQIFSELKDKGLDKTLAERETLTGHLLHMANEMADKREWFLSFEDINDPEALIKADQRWYKWLEQNGYGDREGSGRFAFGKHGRFENYNKYLTRKVKTLSIIENATTEKHVNNWLGELGKEINEKDTLNSILDRPEAVVSGDDMYGVFADSDRQVGQLSSGEDANIRMPKFSAKFLIKAHALGVQPSVLLKRQGAAYLASIKDKNSTEYTQLKTWLDNYEGINDPVLNIRDNLAQDSKSDSKDLLNLLEFRGIENLSPNQLDRLNDTQTRLNPSEADIEEANAIITEKLKSIGYEDEAIIDLIDQGLAWDQWEQFKPK